MLYYFCRPCISLLSSDKQFTDALGSFSSFISLLLMLQASYISLVAELVPCLFVWGFVVCWGFFFVLFQNIDPVSISPSCIEQDVNN